MVLAVHEEITSCLNSNYFIHFIHFFFINPTLENTRLLLETSDGYLRHDPEIYDCPLYVTRFRGPTYTVMCQLKSTDPVNKWVLAGVAIICQEDE